MGELTSKQLARLRALREVSKLIGAVNYGVDIQFPFESSPHLDDKGKKMIRREIELIQMQLLRRVNKLEDKLYGRSNSL